MPEIKFDDLERKYYSPLPTENDFFSSTKKYVKKELHMTHLLDGTIRGVHEACRYAQTGEKFTLRERVAFISQNKDLVDKLTTYIEGKIKSDKDEKKKKVHGLFQNLRKWFIEKRAAFASWRLHHKIDPIKRELEKTQRELEETERKLKKWQMIEKQATLGKKK